MDDRNGDAAAGSTIRNRNGQAPAKSVSAGRGAPLNVWYLNHYGSPPNRGRGERPLAIAAELSRHGHAPLLVMAAYHHLLLDDGADLPTDELIDWDGIPAIRLAARKYRGNGFGRLLNMRDFAAGISRLESLVRQQRLAAPDVLIYSSPHPYGFAAAARLARRTGAKLIFEERDLWPLSLIELAGVPWWHPISMWTDWTVRGAYRRAEAVVSLAPLAREYMQSRGLAPHKFHYIANGISIDRWQEMSTPLPEPHARLFAELRRAGKLIVTYAGAHGAPNALEQILALSRFGTGERGYHFVLIGDGPAKESLAERLQREGQNFVTLLPSIPKDAVPAALRESDVCFMPLKDSPIFQYGVSPNKLFDYLMAGRPVLYAIRSGNRPVDEAQAGLSIEPESPAELERALRSFQQMSRAERDAMGARGKAWAAAQHGWESLGARYAELCASLCAPTNRQQPRQSRAA